MLKCELDEVKDNSNANGDEVEIPFDLCAMWKRESRMDKREVRANKHRMCARKQLTRLDVGRFIQSPSRLENLLEHLHENNTGIQRSVTLT